MRALIAFLLLLFSASVWAVIPYEAWKGAVEPLDDGTASSNIYEAWKGASEPTETVASSNAAAVRRRISMLPIFLSPTVTQVSIKAPQ